MSSLGESAWQTTRTFAWLFAALAMVALLSQPGATHDEWYHVSSVWCGHGEREPFCPRMSPEHGSATINVDLVNCKNGVEEPLLCPINRSGYSEPLTNFGLYPKGFYFVLSWFVVPWSDYAVAVVRIVNALVISVVLGLLLTLLPPRYRLVLSLTILTTFSGTGYFLFASINPSSWTAFGIGSGWLGVHAAVTSIQFSKRRRTALLLVGLVAWSMALGSRWDSASFLAVVVALVALHLVSLRTPKAHFKIGGALAVLLAVMTLVLEVRTPLRPSIYIRRLLSFEPGEPNNVTFFTHYVFQGLPNVLRSLGTVPTMSQLLIPDFVYVLGLAVLVACIGITFNRHSRLQTFGALLIIASISLVIMIQVAVVDDRDAFGVEPRYSYPLLLFLASWWFLLGPTNLHERLLRYFQPLMAVNVALFALTMFTVAERFVDKQTFGLRYLPEGPDQWWWSGLPVGPNVVLILAPICLWKFFSGLKVLVEQDDHQVIVR